MVWCFGFRAWGLRLDRLGFRVFGASEQGFRHCTLDLVIFWGSFLQL